MPKPGRKKTKFEDLILAPVLEAALLVAAGLLAWAVHRPLLFASLGPTIFELVEQPHRQSAKPYNILLGHLIGVLAGFGALALTGAWHMQAVTGTSHVTPARVWAAGLAALLTVFVTTLLRATQPAAISTSLGVALGAMQQFHDGLVIMLSIALMVALGEPVRRWRLGRQQHEPREPDISHPLVS